MSSIRPPSSEPSSGSHGMKIATTAEIAPMTTPSTSSWMIRLLRTETAAARATVS